MSGAPNMMLHEALSILCAVHTRDDYEAGYVVEMGAIPTVGHPCSMSQYVQAWAVVRRAIGTPIDAAEYTPSA